VKWCSFVDNAQAIEVINNIPMAMNAVLKDYIEHNSHHQNEVVSNYINQQRREDEDKNRERVATLGSAVNILTTKSWPMDLATAFGGGVLGEINKEERTWQRKYFLAKYAIQESNDPVEDWELKELHTKR